MPVNERKPIRLKNRTKYFDPDHSKSHVTFSSPESYQSRRIKIEGYEIRLYWQFRYCEDHGGQTFFYTLTYNDAHIPQFYGINCFDYEDLRDLLTGGFRKILLRKYGTAFKYFIGAELGDGKGQRGMANNPHYHVLFFLESANNKKYPYKKIDAKDFRNLVRTYWQGFDQDVDGFKDFRDAKYGIAKEGEHLGVVQNFRACCYCAKYVCKDANLKRSEEDVERSVRYRCKNDKSLLQVVSDEFFHTVLYDYFNTPLNARKTKWSMSDKELLLYLLPNLESYVDIFGELPDEVINWSSDVASIVRKYSLHKEFYELYDKYVDEVVRQELNEYRNRYCNKCRISHGVGDYALEHVHDKLDPTIQVPSKKGFKNRPLSMYYYRKMFTTVHIDKKGSPIRILNADGVAYKLNRLQSQISKKVVSASNNLALVLSDSVLFDKMRSSDVNTDVFYSHSQFVKKYNSLLKDEPLDQILYKYAIYKLVYEDRFLPFSCLRPGVECSFPPIDVEVDYLRFLSSIGFSRDDLRLDAFLESCSTDYLSYSSHPYFLRYVGLFAVLDLCADYFFIQSDKRSQSEAELISATKRFHSEMKLNDFYSQFK